MRLVNNLILKAIEFFFMKGKLKSINIMCWNIPPKIDGEIGK